MIYVMSDLHGEFDKYLKMLEKINFGKDDELHLLGDIGDRGPKSAQLFLDVMRKDNVFCIMGNHESMLLGALPNAFSFLQNEFDRRPLLDFDVWSACGGGRTCASLREVGDECVRDIYRFIRSLPYYKTLDIDGKQYLLVHAGLGNYDRTKLLEQYLQHEFLWFGFDHNGTYYPMEFDRIIVGHTPTFLLSFDRPSRIFHGKGNVSVIDCGAFFEERGGRLGCLCLNTMEEFYV